MLNPHLIVITGPVAAGKSTVSRAAARQLQAAGQRAAWVEMDLLYSMARQRDGFGDAAIWSAARRGAAALADSFYASGMRVVIVEGAFYGGRALEELKQPLASKVRETFVTLHVSAPEALRRALTDRDPNRVASRDPELQRVLYREFASALPFLSKASHVLDAELAGPEALARSICQLALACPERVRDGD